MSELKKERKVWSVRTADKKTQIVFSPMFEIKTPGIDIDVTEKEVECRFVDIEFNDDKGKEHKLTMNYLDLFMFAYMCATEELRQQLQMRYERQAGSIPYEVTFSLSPEEKQSGIAKRLITLTVDEITMAIARAGANQILHKVKPESIESYIHRKKKQTMSDPGHYTNMK